jgi:hypothetical protein
MEREGTDGGKGGRAETPTGVGGQPGAMGGAPGSIDHLDSGPSSDGGAPEIGLKDGSFDAVETPTVDAPPRDGSGDFPVESGPRLLQVGEGCSLATACVSGNCVEGVCCDSPCTGICTSCRQARTSVPDGTCGSVASGRDDPQSRCGSAAASASCGTTGHCDGLGACEKYSSATVCVPTSCSGSQFTPAVFCDGLGNCPAPAPRGCDPYTCATSSCKTTCATSADCTSTNYCSGTSCVPKKGLGAVCATPGECSTSICGGRCCLAPCTCPQQSAGNLLINPGFDTNLTGWSIPAVASQWSSQDVDGCPFSGAFQVISSGLGLAQCVAVTPGANYSFAGWFRNPTAALYFVSFLAASDANCSTSVPGLIAESLSGTETDWTFRLAAVSVPSTANHLRISIDTNSGLFVDKLSLSSNGGF